MSSMMDTEYSTSFLMCNDFEQFCAMNRAIL